MQFTADQQNAADKFMHFLLDPTQREFLIEGSAGVGKTTLVEYLINLSIKQEKLLNTILGGDVETNTFITASTNKAANVLHEKLGRETSTIHSLLGLKVTNDYSSGKTVLQRTRDTQVFSNSLIFIDEASMVDSALLKLIRELTMDCKVVYIGDPYQLAPIFETESPVFNSVQNKAVLREVVRQASGSPITTLALQYREAVEQGVFPHREHMNVPTVTVLSPQDFKQKIEEDFRDPYTDTSEKKILAWTNAKVLAYNKFIRELQGLPDDYVRGETLITNNPIIFQNFTIPTDSEIRIDGSRRTAYEGMPGQNIYVGAHEVFVPDSLDDLKAVLKQYSSVKNWTNYFKIKDYVQDLRPIHALTIHKSQGSTYKRVYINLSDIGRNNKKTEVARLLYVAISRASEEVFLYGELPDKYYGDTQQINI